jgi:hypothetical protein
LKVYKKKKSKEKMKKKTRTTFEKILNENSRLKDAIKK